MLMTEMTIQPPLVFSSNPLASENNAEICRLQERWEAAAWRCESTARALRLAVAWLREDAGRTAHEAERVFFQ